MTESPEKAHNRDLFLMRLHYKEGYKEGHLLKLTGNQPILLNQPDLFWVVYSGEVDLFSADYHEGQFHSAREFLFHVGAGEAIFGTPTHPQKAFLASGATGTELVALPRPVLLKLAEDPAFTEPAIEMIDTWLSALSGGVFRLLPPNQYTALTSSDEVALAKGTIARSRHELLWVQILEGQALFNGRDDIPLDGSDEPLPLGTRSWLEFIEDSKMASRTTPQIIRDGHLLDCLDRFHQLALYCVAQNSTRQLELERARLEARSAADGQRVDSAIQQLSAILESQQTITAAADLRDPLLVACQLVGDAMGIAVHAAPPSKSRHIYPMQHIATASRFRVRQVALKGEWWKQDNGPLVGSITEEDTTRYIALIPASPTAYTLHDPINQTSVPVTAAVAEALNDFAYLFYRPLPERSLKALDLTRYALRGHRSDFLTVLLISTAAGILGLVLPLVTGQIFDAVLPGVQRTELIQLGLVLVVSSISAALFDITRNIALLRIEGKVGTSLQAAIMDRVLDLPATFFRTYSTGDLGVRVSGMDGIRRAVSGAVITSVLSSVFSVFSFGILFAFDVRLGLVALGLLVVLFLVIALSSILQLKYERALRESQGTVSSIVFQFIVGVSKFRVAGAEKRAFAYWANHFGIQRKLRYQSRVVNNYLATFNAIFPVVTLIAIFSVVAFSDSNRLSTGQFLAFIAAFTQVSAAVLALSGTFSMIISIIPTYERSRPILETMPEVSQRKSDPGELHGEVELSNVSFRYAASGPLILDKISLHVRPGQFIALVGPSGSGKSTLLRLLLGFETPQSGTILYDQQDLSELDIRAVRRQIGVVLQNGKLMVGDIYRNIVGASTLTVEEAWDAAQMVGLREDIAQMPMGMNTIVSEGGGTLSGGQRQRLMIARAIVNKPRLIFFDEATSALDNRTQKIVSQSLENLEATRIVIAHRLSTIANADYIYVMENGQIIQRGTYQELIKQKGLFADLARRQLA